MIPGPNPLDVTSRSRPAVRTARVCVVGAGLAGVACARALTTAGHDVRVVDRGRAAGGRMGGRRLAGRPVDLGASYFTVSDNAFGAVVQDWADRGLARPWTSTFASLHPDGRLEDKTGPVRWGAQAGLRSLVVDLAAPLTVEQEHEVVRVGPGPVVDGERYDAVVLAMPDPQALRVLDPAAAAAALLADRAWEPVLALAAGFDERSWDLDGAFVQDDAVLSFIADDGRRRGDGAPVLVAHSTPGFAAHVLAGDGVDTAIAAAAPMVEALRRVLGVAAPAWTHLHRWTYAKPVGRRAAPYALAEGIGLCGDGWGASKVETAWVSGNALGQALAAEL